MTQWSEEIGNLEKPASNSFVRKGLIVKSRGMIEDA
jgi:hypothetical protein